MANLSMAYLFCSLDALWNKELFFCILNYISFKDSVKSACGAINFENFENLWWIQLYQLDACIDGSGAELELFKDKLINASLLLRCCSTINPNQRVHQDRILHVAG